MGKNGLKNALKTTNSDPSPILWDASNGTCGG